MKFPTISLPGPVTRTAAKVAFKTQKNSPTILLGVGLVAGVATVVTACQATLKLEETLIDIQKKKLELQEANTLGLEGYSTETDYKKWMTILNINGGLKVAKLYAPAFVLGVTAVACLTSSHKILMNRNTGLAAAYAAIDKAFSEYRGKVIEEHGEEKDREYRFGKETKELVTTDSKGRETKKEVTRKGRNGGSIYARYFGDDNQNYTSAAPEYNVAFLRGVQTMCNQRLQAHGHLFLNEVYDDLGMDRSPAGAIVGWKRETGDGFVDFGIWDDTSMQRFHDFVLGHEGIWLDFNVNGPIWDQI